MRSAAVLVPVGLTWFGCRLRDVGAKTAPRQAGLNRPRRLKRPAEARVLWLGAGSSEKLDTKHTKPGQSVVVEVTRDVKSGDQVVLKKGSLVKGTVTEVQAFSKGSSAQLEIAFDRVAAKDGEQIPAHFAVYALAAQLEKQPGDIYATQGYKGLANSASVSGQGCAG